MSGTGSGSGSASNPCRTWVTPEGEGPIPHCTVTVYPDTENPSKTNCKLCLKPVAPEEGSGTGSGTREVVIITGPPP
jgi:hypothetical protein